MIENVVKFFTEIVNYVNQKCDEYKSELDKVVKLWNTYKNAISTIKRDWDVDSVIMSSRINQLKVEIDTIKEQMEFLKIKRELELIDNETYMRNIGELNELLVKLKSMYEELSSRYESLEVEIKEHWIRSIDVATTTTEQVNLMVKDLENARERGEIPSDLYEKLKYDLDILKRVIQAMNLVRIERKREITSEV